MRIVDTSPISARDRAYWAWQQLRLFESTSYTLSRIVSIHGLQSFNKDNAKRQAEEIRYCLRQAREYWEAARASSLATKALHLYYCLSALAIAETLYKQPGNGSTFRLRAHDSHHGLTHAFPSKLTDKFAVDAHALVARPHLNKQRIAGLFGLWSVHARRWPLVGKRTFLYKNRTTQTGPSVLLIQDDSPLLDSTWPGMSLLSVFQNTPGMVVWLNLNGVWSLMCKGLVEMYDREDNEEAYKLQTILHPAPSYIIEPTIANIRVPGSRISDIDYSRSSENSLVLIETVAKKPGVAPIHYPDGINVDTETIYFHTSDIKLNEFGIYYVGLFICGMLCRYYPDMWIRDIERSTVLSGAIGHFLDICEDRLPILALGELRRVALVSEA